MAKIDVKNVSGKVVGSVELEWEAEPWSARR